MLAGAAIIASRPGESRVALVWVAMAGVVLAAFALGMMRRARQHANAMTRRASRLEDHLEQAPCALALTDDDLQLTACNTRFAEFTGFVVDELIGMNVAEVLQTAGAEELITRLDAVCRGGDDARFDICLVHHAAKRSRPTWVEVSVSRLGAGTDSPAHSGAPGGLRLALWDMGARKAREDGLAQREQLAMSSAQLGFWEWDVTRRRLAVSPRWAEIVGYAVDELPDDLSLIDMLAHPDDLVPFREKLIPHLRGETTDFVLEHRLRHKWGFWVWVRDTGRVVARDSDGRATRLIGVNEDITAIRHAEAALAQSQEKQSLAMQSAQLGLWDWHVPTGEAVFGPRCAEIAGLRLDELQPHIAAWERLVHPDDWSALRAQLEPTLRGDSDEYALAHRLRHKEGHWVWVRHTGKVLERDDTGTAVRLVGLYQDISAQKADELALIFAKESAVAANRAKSEFLADMSHEIRTPVNAIVDLSQGVLDAGVTPRQHDDLHKVLACSKALLGVLDDLLDDAKIEAGRMAIEPVSFALEEPLNTVAILFGAQLEHKGLALRVEIAPDAPKHVIGDLQHLSQVLNKLVGNAIKFTERGVVHVKVEVASRDDTGHVLRIVVADTGIGMPKAQMERLLQAFAQTENAITRTVDGTGLGMGLSISHRLVRLMGGQIGVGGQQGQGCTFSFTVRMGRLPQEHPDTSLHAVRGLRALVVDDQETSRLIMGHMLEAWGVHADTAGSAVEGLERVACARKADSPYDLLLLDWRMPEMSGLEMAAALRSRADNESPMPFVIMVSAYGREQLIEASGSVPVDLVLAKPVAPSTLFDVMMRMRRPGALAPYKTVPAQPERTTFPGARILLVEDNPLNQDVAREFLSGIGGKVSTASHGGEAVRLIEQHTYDLVLMDLHMPIMGGLEATRRIRELRNGKGLPVIAMTAAVMGEDRDRCARAGMADFVAKPVNADDLVRVLHAWLPRSATAPQPARASALTAGASAGLPGYSLPSRSVSIRPKVASRHLTLRLDGFACELALRRLHGNADRLRELLIEFTRRHADTATQLQALSQAGQTDELILLAHAIKGAASNLGLMRQAALAQELESSARFGDHPVAVAHFNRALGEALLAIATLDQDIALVAHPAIA